jgi:hypothetical protein
LYLQELGQALIGGGLVFHRHRDREPARQTLRIAASEDGRHPFGALGPEEVFRKGSFFRRDRFHDRENAFDYLFGDVAPKEVAVLDDPDYPILGFEGFFGQARWEDMVLAWADIGWDVPEPLLPREDAIEIPAGTTAS